MVLNTSILWNFGLRYKRFFLLINWYLEFHKANNFPFNWLIITKLTSWESFEYWPSSSDLKKGHTENWTRIIGFKVQCANHYTIRPPYLFPTHFPYILYFSFYHHFFTVYIPLLFLTVLMALRIEINCYCDYRCDCKPIPETKVTKEEIAYNLMRTFIVI